MGALIFCKTKKDVPMGCKAAVRGQGSIVSPLPPGGQRRKPTKNFDFFPLKLGKTAFVKVKIQ